MKLTLYGYWRSSCTYRVRIALAHKGIPFDSVPIHLLNIGGEQFSDLHRARNPLAQVPALHVDAGRGESFTLSQSIAILEYLDESFPDKPLLPQGLRERALTRMFVEMINSGIQPLQNLSVMRAIDDDLKGDSKAWARRWIERGLSALEVTASSIASRENSNAAVFVVGNSLTLADVCLIPQLYNAKRFSIDLAPYPRLRQIEASCSELPAFQAAHPNNQPDAEPDGPRH